MKGSLIRAGLAFALAGSLMIGFVGPAGAAAANTCKTLKGSATLKPVVPITGSSRPVIHIKGTVGGCSPTKTTGGATGTVTGTLKDPKPSSCASFVKGGGSQKGTMTTKWKNGKTSTFTVTTKEGTGGNFNIATITGTVTVGLFKGKHVSGQAKFTPNSGACTSKPFSSLTFQQTKPLVLK